MPSSGPGWVIREPTVHCATQGLPGYALQGATVEGVVIAHGGPPALGAQQHQRLGAGAQGRQPRPPPAAPAPTPSSSALACWGFRAWSGLERLGAWRLDVGSSQRPAASNPFACLGSPYLGSILWPHEPSKLRHGRRPCPATNCGPAPGGAAWGVCLGRHRRQD